MTTSPDPSVFDHQRLGFDRGVFRARATSAGCNLRATSARFAHQRPVGKPRRCSIPSSLVFGSEAIERTCGKERGCCPHEPSHPNGDHAPSSLPPIHVGFALSGMFTTVTHSKSPVMAQSVSNPNAIHARPVLSRPKAASTRVTNAPTANRRVKTRWR